MMWQAIWDILCDSAIYILVGFLIAGLLHVIMAGGRAIGWLSAGSSRSVFLATMVGVPLPLCSCSVLPAAVTLRQKGASKGATLSFLISTPETSATSIMLTYSLLGPLMAIVRPIAACVTALSAGLIENFVGRRSREAGPSEPEQQPAAEGSSCCATEGGGDAKADARPTFRQGLHYAFVDLFDDIFIWIVLGIVVAAAIRALMPAVLFESIFTGAFSSMLLMLVLSVPLYVCAEGSTPIAAALIMQGLNPGAALVLLLAGPATNIGSVGVLNRLLGRRTVVIYLVTIAIVSILMGGLLNIMLAFAGESSFVQIRTFGEPLVPGWLKIAGAVGFLALGWFTIRRKRYWARSIAWLDSKLSVSVTTRSFLITAGLAAGLAYAASGFRVVQPGEVGIVRRCGAVVRSDLRPGLHYAWPFPIDAVDRVPVRRVHRTVLGFKQDPAAAATPETDPRESWILIGDENVADIKTAVHWGAIAERVLRFEYGVADRERLVRSVTLGAIREVLGGQSINTAFTTRRRDCQERIEQLIRERLRAYDAGIRVDAFCFLDTHAPPEVHDAFRDVAGALEDRATQINLALNHEAQVVPLTRGDAERRRASARGYSATTVAQSKGEAQRFLDLLRNHLQWPRVTQKRMYFETLDEILPRARKYIKTTGAGEVEVWLVNPRIGGNLPWQEGADMR